MRKIPTLFKRDPDDLRRVLPVVTPGCEWVLAGEGVPTRKYDGTCLFLDGQGDWWARREVKPGKDAPPDYCLVEVDENTGKMVGWEPIDQTGWGKFLDEALARSTAAKPMGTYELCGPKVNGNPEHLPFHSVLAHADAQVLEVELSSGVAEAALIACRAYLLGPKFVGEGIVWHHPDGRMAKLKVRDFR